MYFWKNKFIPKELQEHINRTIAKIQKSSLPTMPAEEVKEFLEKSQTIISGSIANKNKPE